MHTIYTTEGFILKSMNFGEANKYFFIFTRDFGLIKATAQSVRHLQSKLRYGLGEFCLSNVSFVRGKEIWRLTGAEKQIDFSLINDGNSEKFLLVSRIFSLLLRLLHGEEKNDLIFDNLLNGLKFLQAEALNKQDIANFECILALKILSALGYIGSLDKLDDFISSPFWTREMIDKMDKIRTKAILEINKSLQETHL